MSQSPRDEIKKLIKESLSTKLSAKANGNKDTQMFKEVVESHAESLLRKFEENTIFQQVKENFKPSFWYSVCQSIIGGILLFFVIGFFVFVIYGYRFNFWGAVENLAKDINENKRIEQIK